MKLLLPYIMAIALGACNKGKHEQTPITSTPSEALAAKKQLYCELSAERIKAQGYAGGKCDGLLFTSLRGIGCGDIGISAFQTDEGRWFRNPEKDCFVVDPVTGEKKNQGADSSISKDMMIGAMSYMWFKKDKRAVDGTIAYGKAHNWVLGDGADAVAVLSKCVLSPNLISRLFDIDKGLGNSNLRDDAELASEQIPVNTGFRAHLDIVDILLGGSVHGSLSDMEFSTLKAQAERQPRNALYVAALAHFNGGDMQPAIDLLLDPTLFPPDRLPTSSEYCTDYLYQRDDTLKDWGPCTDRDEVHDGTDFAFAASVIDGTYFTR